MVHAADAAEADGVVAIVTGLGAEYMVRRFSGRYPAVMAGSAFSENITMVEARVGPGIVNMAVITDVAADDVRWMFTGRTAVVVAQAAFHWRALELSAYVATGTVDVFVSPGERETGGEVVECFCSGALDRQQQ